jgi:Putative adhesin
MSTWDFACSDPVDISIDSWGSGSIVVSGEPTSTVAVEVVPTGRGTDKDDLLAQVQVGFDDGQLYIRGPRPGAFRRRLQLDLTIKAPEGSSCAAKTISADLACVGELSALTMQTASGDTTAASVSGAVTVRSASGDVLLDTAGDIAITTASGDVQAARVGGYARISTASGDVSLGYCAGSVIAQTASGDIQLGAVATGQIELRSASGDMQVAVVPGIGVYLDLASTSGGIRSELDPSDEADLHESGVPVRISCRALSGDIRITKATSVPEAPTAPAADPAAVASAPAQAAGPDQSESDRPEPGHTAPEAIES